MYTFLMQIIIILKKSLLLEFYLVLLPVLTKIHCGIGWISFRACVWFFETESLTSRAGYKLTMQLRMNIRSFCLHPECRLWTYTITCGPQCWNCTKDSVHEQYPQPSKLTLLGCSYTEPDWSSVTLSVTFHLSSWDRNSKSGIHWPS